MADKIKIGAQVLETLVAITQQEHAKGLMHCAWPPPVMTFVLSSVGIHKFWMKNTPSPLDIIFCNAGKIIQIYAGQPYSLRHVGPDTPTDLVVEMPYGTAEKLDIKSGQSVILSYSVPTLAKVYQNRLTKKS